uniref:Uncharacterized protein n=1 Tax=Anguilla anguilla TaxID=7936 RepID=A0A0E9UZ67_ANGAN
MKRVECSREQSPSPFLSGFLKSRDRAHQKF